MAKFQYLTARQVKELAALNTARARKATGRFLAEGEHMVEESIREKRAICLLCADTCVEKFENLINSSLPVNLLSPSALSKLSDTKTPQGILSLCDIPERAETSIGKKVVALNALQDPGNVGTILRTMDATGFDTLIIDEKTADPYSSKAIRASMGAIFRINIIQTKSLLDIVRLINNHEIVAGVLNGENLYTKQMAPAPICLLIGNEGKGLDQEIMSIANSLVKIPMPGNAESLNAAVAAAVLMYEYIRQEHNL
jgi:TrmH family RNA methyltransferase